MKTVMNKRSILRSRFDTFKYLSYSRKKPQKKSTLRLGRFKELKANKPDLKIGVAGCVAQAEGEEIIKRQPLVDLIVGPKSYQNIADLAANAVSGRKQIDIAFPEEDKFSY